MIELKEAELRAVRANQAVKSIREKRCMVCRETLTDRRGNWVTDDVLEGVLLADGPNHLVAEDAHFLAHFDCVQGYLQSKDAVMA